MKITRCESCGREGMGGMVPIRNRWVKRIDGYRCHNVSACNERVRRLGKWTGARVLRRRDLDGTYWEIRRWDDLGLRGNPAIRMPPTSGYVLVMRYRDHRLVSTHPTPAAAKAHVEDYLASLRARSLREYAGGGER